MKKIGLGQTISVLANLGVLAGIVFLAMEVNQNNALLEAQARFAQSERGLAGYEAMVEVPGLASAMAKLQAGEPLDAVEQVQLRAFAWRVFRNFQWQFDELRFGTLDESVIPTMRAVVSNEGGVGAEIPYRKYWQDYRHRAPPEFVEWFEKTVVNP